MKTKIIKLLHDKAQKINEIVTEYNELFTIRERKNAINDAIIYKLFSTNNTQTMATTKLNDYRTNNQITSRQAISKKEAKVSLSLYQNISDIFSEECINAVTDNYTEQIIAVDGTYLTLLKEISNSGYKLNKNKESTTPLVTGIYNITKNFPITLELAKTKNERKAFIDYVKNKHMYRNNVFLFDRGYEGQSFYKKLINDGISFICRMKKNSTLIKDDVEDEIVNIDDSLKVRVVNYAINNVKYYIATNKFEYSKDLLVQLYHCRWNIEEYYKHIKYTTNIDKLNDRKEMNVRKKIICSLIVSQISYIISNNFKSKDKNRIVNKRKLTEGIFEKIIYKIFMNKKITKYFFDRFVLLYVEYVYSQKDRKFEHKCKRRNYKSYFNIFIKNKKYE